MRRALESLPWVRKAEVNFAKKQATITAVSSRYDEAALLKALKDAGFGGTVVKPDDGEAKQKPVTGTQIAFHVTGMRKTKSGAT